MSYHAGRKDGRHYWLTPPELLKAIRKEFGITYDPCPFPQPKNFNGLAVDWGKSSYVNPPFGTTIIGGKKKGPTAWARKCIEGHKKGKTVVFIFPLDKWILMLLEAGAEVRNLGNVKFVSIEDPNFKHGTGRHIAQFILRAPKKAKS